MQPGWRSKLAGLSELTGRSDRNVLKQGRSPMTGHKKTSRASAQEVASSDPAQVMELNPVPELRR